MPLNYNDSRKISSFLDNRYRSIEQEEYKSSKSIPEITYTESKSPKNEKELKSNLSPALNLSETSEDGLFINSIPQDKSLPDVTTEVNTRKSRLLTINNALDKVKYLEESRMPDLLNLIKYFIDLESYNHTIPLVAREEDLCNSILESIQEYKETNSYGGPWCNKVEETTSLFNKTISGLINQSKD